MADLLSWANDKRKKVQNFASRAYDQVNIVDNGLSYDTRQINPAIAPQSAKQQLAPIGKAIIRPPAQMANTAAVSGKMLHASVAQNVAARTNNQLAYQNAQNRINSLYGQYNQQNGGLLDTGTFYNEQDARMGDLKTGAQKIGGGTLQTAATVLPFAKGGSVLTGLTSKAPLLPLIPKLAAEGAAYGGAFSAGYQEQETGRIDPKTLLRDTAIGAGANVAIPAGIRGVQAAAASPAGQAAIQFGQKHPLGLTVGGPLGKGFDAAKNKGEVFDGVDGKPRYEIDDSAAKINKEKIGYQTPLSDILDHPTLYNDYPELKDIKVTKTATDTSSFDGKEITLGAYSKSQKKALLHEVQHVIQKREDFAAGGEPQFDTPELQKLAYEYTEAVNKGDTGTAAAIRQAIKDKSFDDYQRLAGEAEARAVAARSDMPKSKRYVSAELGHKRTDPFEATTEDEFTNKLLKEGKATVIRMTPDEYLERAGKILRRDAMVGLDEGKAKAYARAMQKGDKFPMTWMDNNYGAQQGRHRAYGAKLAGQETIPVVISTDTKSLKISAFEGNSPAKPSTFYDSLDVPKNELIVKGQDGKPVQGKSMSVEQSVERMKHIRDGDERYYDYDVDKVARERFDIPKLKKISSGGSDRDVFDLGDGNVLKVSKTARGLIQNQAENDWYASQAGLLPEVQESGLNYVVAKKVNPPDANTTKMVNEMRDKFGYSDFEKKTPELQEFLEKHDLSDVLNYDILQGDFTAIRNWGTTPEGKPIHIDGGTLAGQQMREAITKSRESNAWSSGKKNLDDPDFRAVYDRSRAAKKKYGDTDKHTMYSTEKPFKVQNNRGQLSEEARKYKSAEEFIDSFKKEKPDYVDSSVVQNHELLNRPIHKVPLEDISEYQRNAAASASRYRTSADKVDVSALPVTLRKETDGTISIADGNHRIAQALRNGDDSVTAIFESDVPTKYGKGETLTEIYNKANNLQSIQQADNSRPKAAAQTAYENAKNAGDTAGMAKAGKDLDPAMRGEYTLNTAARDLYIKSLKDGKPITMAEAKAQAGKVDPALQGKMLPPEVRAKVLADFQAKAKAARKTADSDVMMSIERPDPAKQHMEQLRAKIKEYIELDKKQGGLTVKQSLEYRKLESERVGLMFENHKTPSADKVVSAAESKSTLSPEVVVANRNDLYKNHTVWDAIHESTAGVYFDANTPIDDIMTGANKKITPSDFYKTFEGTRAALRRQYGDTVTVYRAEGKQQNKYTKNWATTREFAEQFGDNIITKKVNVDDVLAANITANGKYHELIVGKPPASPPKPPVKPPTATPAGTPGRKPRKPGVASLPETIRNSPGTDAKLRSIIEDSGYTVKPNKETLAKATEAMHKNPMELIEEVIGMKVGKNATAVASVTGKALPTADQVAKSMVTIDYLARNGLYKQGDELVKNLTKQSTALGQAVQILSAYARTTPAGIYKYATKLAQDAGKELKPKVLDGLIKDAKAIEKLPDGRAKEVGRALLLKKANEVLPSTAGDKAAMALYLAQLLNLKTATRNIVGNALLLGAQNMADLMAAPIDLARVALRGGQRQVYAPNLYKQTKSLVTGVKQGTEDALMGIDTRGLIAGKWDAKSGVFRGKIGRKLETALSVELSAFDRGFYQVAYDQTISNLTRGAKATKATPEMEAIADAFGKYMTFQDDTVLARLAVGLKKTLNLNKSFGAGNAIINYPRTPANLINRASAFSPIGFAKATAEAYRLAKGHPGASAAAVEQAFTRAAVGSTGLVGMGYLLHDLNILQANENKNKSDVTAFQRATGGGAYTINVSALGRYVESGFNKSVTPKQKGDKTMTYDWAQPLAVSLTIGANASESRQSTKTTRQKLTSSFGTIGADAASGLQTIVEQPLLQGVQRAFNAQNPLYGMLDTAKAVPNSFVPALVRQTRQLTDDSARTTYSPNIFKESANMVQNSIPGASKYLPAQINPATGEPNPSIPGGKNNAFNVYVNPAFISEHRGTEVTDELNRIYEKEGDAAVIPNTVQKSYQIEGKTRVLTAKEYDDIQKYVGENNTKTLAAIIGDSRYAALDDATKANIISNALSEVTSDAKKIYLTGDTAADTNWADKIAREEFELSDDTHRTIGDRIYYKDEEGKVRSKTATPKAAAPKAAAAKRSSSSGGGSSRTVARKRNGFQAPSGSSGMLKLISRTADMRTLLKNAKVSVRKA